MSEGGADSASLGGLLCACAGGGEAVGVGAGLDDGSVEGEAVDDGCAEAGVGEGFGPAAEGFVRGDGDAVLLLAFGQDLEEEFGAVAVEFHVLGRGRDAVHPFRCRFSHPCPPNRTLRLPKISSALVKPALGVVGVSRASARMGPLARMVVTSA
jgi:hypothetical protein